MKKKRTLQKLVILFSSIALIILPVSAMFNAEGLPFTPTATGTINGEVQVFGTYGLKNPPITLSFSLPRDPAYAVIYYGVWGGTERYTGWSMITVNNNPPRRTQLFGQDDMNQNVLESGNGVYFISEEATSLLHAGENVITATDSRGEAGSKIDGRIYGIWAVVAMENDGSATTQYFLFEGNENLHGEGWAGKNPTRKNSCSIDIPALSLGPSARANLTVLTLCGTKGQPDYVTFNGNDLGAPAQPANEYPPGARDIANEQTGDANGGTGISSRYVDMETFDVTSLIKSNNVVGFERGRDSNNDGKIATTGAAPEGEDYLHPCLALLSVTQPGKAGTPAYSLGKLEVRGAYTGNMASVSSKLINSGVISQNPVTVTFSVDGTPVSSFPVTPDKSGIQVISTNWTAKEGSHTLDLSLPGGVTASQPVKVGSPPKISIKIGEPRRPGESGPAGTPTAKSPLPPITAVAALAAVLLIARRPPGRFGSRSICTTLIVCMLATTCGVIFIHPVAGADGPAGMSEYSIPVTVSNSGGSDQPEFDIALYIDGEKVAVRILKDGLAAGITDTILIPVYVTPGKHTIAVVAGLNKRIVGGDPTATRVERTYDFP